MMQLENKRILIVEDEYFIAAELQRALNAAGAEIVGPVGNLVQGLRMLDDGPLDAALLDVNLDGSTSFPIADALEKAGVPHVFLTGYDSRSLPERYREQQHLGKPYAIGDVVSVVAELCAEETAA